MKQANAVVAGVAVLAVAGGVAIAANTSKHPVHEITVSLPGGGVEHIRYTGSVAPEVVVTDGPALSVSSENNPFFWPGPNFAELDRISAEMDHFWTSFDKQMAGLMNADQDLIARMASDPNKPLMASFVKLPSGGYSYVSQFSLNGACAKSVTITQHAGDAKPQVVSKVSGNCAQEPKGATTMQDPGSDHAMPVSARTTLDPGPAPRAL